MSPAAVGSPGDGALPFAAAEYLCPQVEYRHRFHAWFCRGGLVEAKVYTYTSLRDAVYTENFFGQENRSGEFENLHERGGNIAKGFAVGDFNFRA